MRRGSAIGPVILIGLGLLFLMRNFIPDFRVWDMIGRHWPWLLIAWGTLRVLEVLHWHREGKLAPRGGMNGGEWGLVIFICIVGSIVFQARNSNFLRNARFDVARWELIGESFDYSIDRTQPAVGKSPRIVIENARGNTRINGINTEDIRVSGTKTIRAVGKQEADSEDHATAFEVVRSGDQIVIRTNLERASNSRQAKADLDITVPRGASIEARGELGDFDIENIGGNIEVSSENAAVRLNQIGGDVRVDLRRSDIVRVANAEGNVDVKGRGQDVELENIKGMSNVNGQYTGELKFRNLAKPFRFESQSSHLRFERIDGEVEMVLGRLNARKVIGPIQITGKSKDIELTDYSDTLQIDVDRGDVHLRPSGVIAKMNVRTKSGNVELVLPEGAKLDLKAEVKKGRIENDFGAPFRVDEDGRKETLFGQIGNGPEVALNVDRGEVRVRKTSGEDALELPVSPDQENSPRSARPSKAPREREITKQ